VSGTLRERRGRWWRPRHGLLALAAAAALGGPTAPASAATNPFTITLVARQCHAYTDVMANLARNDIQESLRDLGKNSRVLVRAAHQPEHRGSEQPELHADHGLAVHLRRRDQRR